MAERALKSIPAARDEAPGVTRSPVCANCRRPRTLVIRCANAGERQRFDRRRSLRWALFALLPLALLVGGYLYVSGGQGHDHR